MNTVVTLDPLEAIDRAYMQGIDTWEAMVALGASDEEEMGIRRWRQGDLGIRVEKHYGEKSLSKYADAIGVKYPTLRQRCVMAQFYQKDTRVTYPLFYSHYREAMRLEDVERAGRALSKAALRDWPVWRLGLFIDRCLGSKRRNSDTLEGTIFMRAGMIEGKYIIEISVSEQDYKRLEDADKVTIRMRS